MRWPVAFTFTDDAGQDREWIVPVVRETRIGIGAVIEQQACDIDCTGLIAR